MDFSDLEVSGTLNFSVTDTEGASLDARIIISKGQAPLVEVLGRKTFLTEFDTTGEAGATLALGDCGFKVGHGAGFLGGGQEVPGQEDGLASPDDQAQPVPLIHDVT